MSDLVRYRERMTDNERVFVDAYLGECRRNASCAARKAYNVKDAASYGWEVKQRPHIAGYIRAMLDNFTLSPQEILAELSDIAMGDYGDVLDPETGELSIRRALETGKTHLIKAVTQEVTGKGHRTRVELYDRLQALRALMGPAGLDRQVMELQVADRMSEVVQKMRAPWTVSEQDQAKRLTDGGQNQDTAGDGSDNTDYTE